MVPLCYLCDEEVVIGDDYQAHLQIVHGIMYDEKRNLEEEENDTHRRLEKNKGEKLDDSVFLEEILSKLRKVRDLAEGKIEVNDGSEDENDEDEIVEDGQILQILDNVKCFVENINIENGSEEISDTDESLKLYLSEDDSLECKGSHVDTVSETLENKEIEGNLKSIVKTKASNHSGNFTVKDASKDKYGTQLNKSITADVQSNNSLMNFEPNPLTCLELLTPLPTTDVDDQRKKDSEQECGTNGYEGLTENVTLDVNSNLAPKMIDQGSMYILPSSSTARRRPTSARASGETLRPPGHSGTGSQSRLNVRAGPKKLLRGSVLASTRPNHLALSTPDNKQIEPSVKQLNTSLPLPGAKTKSGLTKNRKKGTECPALPEGWLRKEVVRKTGLRAGRLDVYYITPDGKIVRSKPELLNVIGGTRDLSDFDYISGTMQPAMIQLRPDPIVGANLGPSPQTHSRISAPCRPTAGPPRLPARATKVNQLPPSIPESEKFDPPVIELDSSPPRIENPVVARLASLGCSVRAISDHVLSPNISISRTSVGQAPAPSVTINKLGSALELLGQTRGQKREVLLEVTESQIEGLWALGIKGRAV